MLPAAGLPAAGVVAASIELWVVVEGPLIAFVFARTHRGGAFVDVATADNPGFVGHGFRLGIVAAEVERPAFAEPGFGKPGVGWAGSDGLAAEVSGFGKSGAEASVFGWRSAEGYGDFWLVAGKCGLGRVAEVAGFVGLPAGKTGGFGLVVGESGIGGLAAEVAGFVGLDDAYKVAGEFGLAAEESGLGGVVARSSMA